MFWAAFIAGLCNGIVLFLLEVLSAPKPESASTNVAGH